VQSATDQPAWGRQRLSNELRKQGIFVSGVGIRSIWPRHGLATFKKRLTSLDKKMAAEGIVLPNRNYQHLKKRRKSRTLMVK
jgi:hypothetical protein